MRHHARTWHSRGRSWLGTSAACLLLILACGGLSDGDRGLTYDDTADSGGTSPTGGTSSTGGKTGSGAGGTSSSSASGSSASGGKENWGIADDCSGGGLPQYYPCECYTTASACETYGCYARTGRVYTVTQGEGGTGGAAGTECEYVGEVLMQCLDGAGGQPLHWSCEESCESCAASSAKRSETYSRDAEECGLPCPGW